MSDTQSDTPVYPSPSSIATALSVASPAMWTTTTRRSRTCGTSVRRPSTKPELAITDQLNFFTDLALSKGYASKLGWQFAKADDFPAYAVHRHLSVCLDPPQAPTPSTRNTLRSLRRRDHDPRQTHSPLRRRVSDYQDNSTAWGNTNAGTFQFSGQYTKQWTTDPPLRRGCQAGLYRPGNWLRVRRLPAGLCQQLECRAVSPEYGARLKSPQVFVQDDFKVRPNLTINLGLRYQINHGWNEVTGNMSSFDPTVINPATDTPGAYWFGTPMPTAAPPCKQMSTRLSAARRLLLGVRPEDDASWRFRPLRLQLEPRYLRRRHGQLGLVLRQLSDPPVSASRPSGRKRQLQSRRLDDPGPQVSGRPPALHCGIHRIRPGSTARESATSNTTLRFPRFMQWNFSVQRRVRPRTPWCELAYVASHGSNLSFPDRPQPGAAELSPIVERFRSSPLSDLSGHISGSTNNAISNYNSLQASVTKRMTKGLSLSFNYVWSHFLDDLDSSGWGSRAGPQDYQNAL